MQCLSKACINRHQSNLVKHLWTKTSLIKMSLGQLSISCLTNNCITTSCITTSCITNRCLTTFCLTTKRLTASCLTTSCMKTRSQLFHFQLSYPHSINISQGFLKASTLQLPLRIKCKKFRKKEKKSFSLVFKMQGMARLDASSVQQIDIPFYS